MSQILQPAKLDRRFEQQVEIDNQTYFAGTRNCYLYNGSSVFGSLFLDGLCKVESRVWKPNLSHPFATEIIEMDKKKNILCLDKIIIASTPCIPNKELDFL